MMVLDGVFIVELLRLYHKSTRVLLLHHSILTMVILRLKRVHLRKNTYLRQHGCCRTSPENYSCSRISSRCSSWMKSISSRRSRCYSSRPLDLRSETEVIASTTPEADSITTSSARSTRVSSHVSIDHHGIAAGRDGTDGRSSRENCGFTKPAG